MAGYYLYFQQKIMFNNSFVILWTLLSISYREFVYFFKITAYKSELRYLVSNVT